MSAHAMLLRKEIRQLFWPWAVITASAIWTLLLRLPSEAGWLSRLPDFLADLVAAEWLLFLAFFLGVPLLATLPIGYEFQHRTLPLLLAAPVDRERIWRQKLFVGLLAVPAPTLLFLIGARQIRFHPGELVSEFGLVFVTLAWALVMSTSAIYWTLRARSIMGGMALQYAVGGGLFFSWGYVTARFLPHGNVPASVRIAVAVLVLGYSGAMIWLGRRALLRFQAVDGLGGDDVIEALTSRLLPQRVGDWFLCRPQSPVGNLIRRELRLLRPIWLLAVLAAMGWFLLAALNIIPEPGKPPKGNEAGVIVVVLTTFLSPLIAMLAGVLSVSEDKLYGTHEWHMTLPVSTRLQWGVKLLVALVSAAVGAVLIPILAADAPHVLTGAGMVFFDKRVLWSALLGTSVVTLLSFWLACTVKGTARAALCVLPAMLGLGLMMQLGMWSAESFTAALAGAIDWVLFRLDPFRMTQLFPSSFRLMDAFLWAVILISAGFIMLHSYRLFRGQAQDSNRHLLRAFAPVALVMFLCCFALWNLVGVMQRGEQQIVTLFLETHEAIAKRQAATAAAEAKPLRLTAAELAGATSLSDSTRHWLGNSTITVAPQPARPPNACCGSRLFSFGTTSSVKAAPYVAVIPLSNGLSCSVSFSTARTGYGILDTNC